MNVESGTIHPTAEPTPEGKNRPIYLGNFNLWWFLGTALSIWFTVVHGIPKFWDDITPMFAIHLANACLLSWICIWNLFHSPSHGPIYKKIHKMLGRSSLVFGVLSTVLGYLTVWYERFNGVNVFAIAISIGGTVQVLAQFIAVYHIRRGNVRGHIIWNHAVFFGGCLIPAIMRFPYLIQVDITEYWNTFSWAIPLVIGALGARAVICKSWY